MLVILDNGHGSDTPGKCSPDRSIREYAYARKLVNAIAGRLREEGISCSILVPEDNDISITTRIRRANELYRKDKDCFLVSVHLNAAGTGEWAGASGWSVYVSKNASKRSKMMARTLTGLAKERNLMGNRSIPKEGYWTWDWSKYDIALLKGTSCPAVLTENLFQDNRKDVEYLLSEEGFNTLVELHVTGIRQIINNW